MQSFESMTVGMLVKYWAGFFHELRKIMLFLQRISACFLSFTGEKKFLGRSSLMV